MANKKSIDYSTPQKVQTAKEGSLVASCLGVRIYRMHTIARGLVVVLFLLLIAVLILVLVSVLVFIIIVVLLAIAVEVDHGVLLVLVLGDEVAHVLVGLLELHLVHALALVPVQEGLALVHLCELRADALEHALNGRGVGHEGAALGRALGRHVDDR